MTHDEFEIAIEQRLHGGLDADAAIALDEHLAACEACRRYEQHACADQRGMETMFATHGARLDLASRHWVPSWSKG